MAAKLKFDKEGNVRKKEEKKPKEMREIYPGVKIKISDSRQFISDMMSMDHPGWRWVVRIGVLVTLATNIFIVTKVMG